MIVNPGIRRFLGSAIQRLFNSASFYAPLTHTLALERGTGSPTFTRATTATVRDNEGVLRTAIAGEARFEGARRVRNLLPSTEGAFNAVAGWTLINGTVTSGVSDPLGGTSAYTLKQTGAASCELYPTTPFSGLVLSSLWVRRRTGTGAIRLYGGDTFTVITGFVTTEWQRLASSVTTSSLVGFDLRLFDANDEIDFWHPQSEDITGRADQTTPSEYVSVGVESAPYYHGSFVDGVKCFPNDLAGNALPTSYTYDAVSLNGVAGTYVSTPDSVAASITGDIDIRVKVALVSYTPTTENIFVNKYDAAGNLAYYWILNAAGTMTLTTTPDGSTGVSATSTTATGITAGTTSWLRVTRDVDNGASGNTTKFYKSSDGSTWTQIGADVVNVGTTTIYDSAAPLALGMDDRFNAYLLNGKLYAAQIYNGINGTLAVDFDASRYAGGTTLTGSTGETWTLQGNAVIHPTNSPMLGYQAEGARTNVLLRSETFDIATWAKSAWGTGSVPVVTADQAIAPDGTLTADKIVMTLNGGTTSGDASQIYQTPSTSAGTYTGSVWLKGEVGGEVVLLRHVAGGAYTQLTLTTEWQRFSSTEVRAANNFELTLRGSFGSSNAVTIYAWGAQLELGSFASSSIATTTVAVTRNADVLTYSSAGNVSGTVGWCYAELSLYSATVAATQIAIGTTTANALLYDGAGNATTIIQSYDGTTVVSKGGLTDMSTGVRKRSVSWGGSATTLTGDGATPATGAFDGDMGITAIGVGCFTNGANSWFGTIRNVRIGQRQLSASELGAITS